VTRLTVNRERQSILDIEDKTIPEG